MTSARTSRSERDASTTSYPNLSARDRYLLRTCSWNARFSNLLSSSPREPTRPIDTRGSRSSSTTASGSCTNGSDRARSAASSTASPSSLDDWYATVDA